MIMKEFYTRTVVSLETFHLLKLCVKEKFNFMLIFIILIFTIFEMCRTQVGV